MTYKEKIVNEIVACIKSLGYDKPRVLENLRSKNYGGTDLKTWIH